MDPPIPHLQQPPDKLLIPCQMPPVLGRKIGWCSCCNAVLDGHLTAGLIFLGASVPGLDVTPRQIGQRSSVIQSSIVTLI